MAGLEEIHVCYMCYQHTKSIFARHGIPQIVHSDNGPCYSCKEFKDFAEEYNFRHMTSSPLFPQSNGKAEKGVHIVKQILKKAQDSGSDPYLALLSYRALPLEHGKSPAELLMGRRLCTTLLYSVQGQKHEAVRQKLKHLQEKQKNSCDKPSRSLAPLAGRDTVRVEDSNIWSKKATVLEEVGPRSYTVQTEDGQILRRNCRSLLKTQETLQQREVEGVVTVPVDPPPSATDSSVSAEQTNTSPVLRRSARRVTAPDRLNL
uniref:Integrase catalytic domain-containing protein n=1 Tax=Gouania willdenowi TaxID=441366 RepID=A0A8C5EM65_GOUWI